MVCTGLLRALAGAAVRMYRVCEWCVRAWPHAPRFYLLWRASAAPALIRCSALPNARPQFRWMRRESARPTRYEQTTAFGRPACNGRGGAGRGQGGGAARRRGRRGPGPLTTGAGARRAGATRAARAAAKAAAGWEAWQAKACLRRGREPGRRGRRALESSAAWARPRHVDSGTFGAARGRGSGAGAAPKPRVRGWRLASVQCRGRADTGGRGIGGGPRAVRRPCRLRLGLAAWAPGASPGTRSPPAPAAARPQLWPLLRWTQLRRLLRWVTAPGASQGIRSPPAARGRRGTSPRRRTAPTRAGSTTRTAGGRCGVAGARASGRKSECSGAAEGRLPAAHGGSPSRTAEARAQSRRPSEARPRWRNQETALTYSPIFD